MGKGCKVYHRTHGRGRVIATTDRQAAVKFKGQKRTVYRDTLEVVK